MSMGMFTDLHTQKSGIVITRNVYRNMGCLGTVISMVATQLLHDELGPVCASYPQNGRFKMIMFSAKYLTKLQHSFS